MAKILIVEDELILAMKAEADLTSMGHEVIGIADTGVRAIEIAKKNMPDVILMDIVLKGSMNGIESTVIINRDCPCRIIYMTAHTDEATVEVAKSTTHAGFLYKPFEPYQLGEAIDKALGL